MSEFAELEDQEEVNEQLEQEEWSEAGKAAQFVRSFEGFEARLEAAAARTEDWCAGSVQRLEELEEGAAAPAAHARHQPPARRVFLARDRKRIQMLLRTGAPAPRPAKEPERGKGKGMVMQ